MNEKEIAKFQQATWTRAADGARDNVMRLTASVQGGKKNWVKNSKITSNVFEPCRMQNWKSFAMQSWSCAKQEKNMNEDHGPEFLKVAQENGAPYRTIVNDSPELAIMFKQKQFDEVAKALYDLVMYMEKRATL